MQPSDLSPQVSAQEPKRKIRILYIIDSLSNVGGAELCLLRLTKHLPKDQFECRVLTFYSRPGHDSLLRQFTCPVDHWQVNNIYDRNAFAVARRLARLVRDEKFDIVHTFFQTSDLWAGTIVKMSGAKVLISSRRDMGILRELKHKIGYRLSRGIVDQIQTVSESVRRWTIENDGVDPVRTITIHNGIDTTLDAPASGIDLLRQRLRLEPGTLVVTTVANLRWVKGIDVLAQAAARVVKEVPNVRIFVAGGLGFNATSRAYANSVMDLTARLGIGRWLEFLGQIDDVFALLKASDIFVLPSRSEGLSNALLEAMLSGLPCVATAVGGNPEVVVNGETGYLVPPDNPEELADRILKLLASTDLRSRMGRQGQDRVQREFSLETMASRVALAYRRVLQEKESGSSGTQPLGSSPPWVKPRFRSERPGLAIIETLCSRAGLNKIVRHGVLRDRILVLCYHGVLRHPPKYQRSYATNVLVEEFESQMRFLARNFHLMSISELDTVLKGDQKLQKRSVIVTFDDGYHNNVTNAAPILRAYAIPAIFNISTGQIGTGQLLWPDEVFLRAVHWTDPAFPLPDGGVRALPQDPSERTGFAIELEERCKLLEDSQRIAYLETLRNGGPLPADLHLREVYRFLSWDDVRELKRQDFEIGSHTVTHPILSRLKQGQIESEMQASKMHIERELNVECRAIAYPNGRLLDADENVWRTAEQTGYRMGFTLERGLASRRHRLALNRINVPGNAPESVFESRAAGAYVIAGQRWRA